MVTEARLRSWIRQIKTGARTPRQVIDELKHLPFADAGVARLDTHRRLRCGLPEAIFCEGKTLPQLVAIARRLIRADELILFTRLDPHVFGAFQRRIPGLRYDPVARLAFLQPRAASRGLRRATPSRRVRRGLVLVVTGGTSDLPVAEESVLTLELLGHRTARVYDVGVAGVHRLLHDWALLHRARVIIVVAGMEGALASVVAGLVSCPVIAVPTSVGYGASFQGVTPLLTMLTSCVPGVGVVNIDNGFGAAALAHLMTRSVAQ